MVAIREESHRHAPEMGFASDLEEPPESDRRADGADDHAHRYAG